VWHVRGPNFGRHHAVNILSHYRSVLDVLRLGKEGLVSFYQVRDLLSVAHCQDCGGSVHAR
jgi:hypothetical protein